MGLVGRGKCPDSGQTRRLGVRTSLGSLESCGCGGRYRVRQDCLCRIWTPWLSGAGQPPWRGEQAPHLVAHPACYPRGADVLADEPGASQPGRFPTTPTPSTAPQPSTAGTPAPRAPPSTTANKTTAPTRTGTTTPPNRKSRHFDRSRHALRPISVCECYYFLGMPISCSPDR